MNHTTAFYTISLQLSPLAGSTVANGRVALAKAATPNLTSAFAPHSANLNLTLRNAEGKKIHRLNSPVGTSAETE